MKETTLKLTRRSLIHVGAAGAAALGLRTYAYGLDPAGLGHLETALAEAQQRGWLVVDTRADWKRIFAFE